MIEIQENVAVEIAKALQTAMDPEALRRMTAAGTHSVPAYEAYLEGLSFGLSYVSTGDMYQYLGAREAFDRAVKLDPEFSEAYAELAYIWNGVRNPANIEYGMLDIPVDEISALYDQAIGNAVRTARDEATRTKFLAFQAFRDNRLATALRLSSEYLEQHPNDRDTSYTQLELLLRLGKRDALKEAIDVAVEKNGYDVWVSSQAVQHARLIDDREFIRRHALSALERRPDDLDLAYQVHRSLLWIHDIDRASQLLPRILESDLPDSVLPLAEIRQACAENRLDDAGRLISKLETDLPDDLWAQWMAAQFRGDYDGATALLKNSSIAESMRDLLDFTPYPSFDARAFPELVEFIEAEGGEVHDPVELPFQCNLPAAL